MISARAQKTLWFLFGLLGLPLMLALIALAVSGWWLPVIGRWLAQPAQLAKADAVVVLSGDAERVMHGIRLYQQGFGRELWVTGDKPTQPILSVTDGKFAREVALGNGIPPEAIHLLATDSTWEDGLIIAAQARQSGCQSILVVTSWYHGRRALAVVRRHLAGTGVNVYYSPSTDLHFRPEDWWCSEDGLVAVINELIKAGYYWRHYDLAPWARE